MLWDSIYLYYTALLNKARIQVLRIIDLQTFDKDLKRLISSIVIEVIGRVIFFYKRYFKCKKHKQNHLSNIQPNISTSK